MLLKLQFYYFVQCWLFNDFNPTAMKWKVFIRFFFKFWWGSVGESSSTPPIAPYRDFNKLAKIESDIAYQSIFYWRFWRQCMLGGASDTSVCKILRLCGTILLCLGHKSWEKTLSVIVERTLNSDLIWGIFKNPFYCSIVARHSWLTRVSPSANPACQAPELAHY